jgi:hypothetical protein
MFKWEKSIYIAKGAADFHALLYFLISLCIVLYDSYYKHKAPQNFLFGSWILIMIPLAIIFRFAYYFLTSKNPDKNSKYYDEI